MHYVSAAYAKVLQITGGRAWLMNLNIVLKRWRISS
jgi:hypothetical protein